MKFKPSKWDLVFIIGLGLSLIVLSELEKMEWLLKFPFISLLFVYYIGRIVSHAKP